MIVLRVPRHSSCLVLLLFISSSFLVDLGLLVISIAVDAETNTTGAATTSVSTSNASNAKVTFLHVSDHNSHFFQSSLDLMGENLPPGLNSVQILRVYFGGAARTIGLIKQLKAQALATGINDVIITHGGDAITGTVFYSYFGSNVDSAVMNLVGFDAFVLGDAEFGNGDLSTANFIKDLNFSAVAYNLVPRNGSDILKLPPGHQVQKYIVRDLSDGTKLGICGITDQVIIQIISRLDPGTTFQPIKESAVACVAELQAKGINKIVLLSHAGYENDQTIISTIPGVDVILGGHTHTLLGNSTEYAKIGLQPSGPFAPLTNGSCIMHSWEYFKGVGMVTVEFDSVGNVVSCIGKTYLPLNTAKFTIMSDPFTEKGDLTSADAQNVANYLLGLPMFATAMEDLAVTNVISQYNAKIDQISSSSISTVADNLCSSFVANYAQYCTDKDLMKIGGSACLLAAQGFLFVTQSADMSIQNTGGCRDNILKGNLTYRSAFTFLPFRNLLVTMALSGDQVRRALEDGYNWYLNATDAERSKGGAIPFAAGLRWRVDYTKPFGKRVTNVEVNRRLQSTWTAIDPAAIYVVVTSDYLATPKDGYFTFGEVNKADIKKYVNTYKEYAQSFIDYAKSVKVITTPPLNVWSTQYTVFKDGSIVDLQAKYIQQQSTKPPNSKTSGGMMSTRFIAFGAMAYGLAVVTALLY